MDFMWYIIIAFAILLLALVIGGISRKSDERIKKMRTKSPNLELQDDIEFLGPR